MSIVMNLSADGRLPLTLLFVAFLLTFLITRGITRLIRAGKGPFRDNVSDGLHIHHAVPGIILLIIGAIVSVAALGGSPAAEIAAVMIGIGASLVLDEFALILHMQDVYWSKEGQLSVQVVFLVMATLGLLLLGLNPFERGADASESNLVFFAVTLPLHVVFLAICMLKGKFSTAVVGAFILPVSVVGAIRLARPWSRWAKRNYSPTKMDRARARSRAFDARYGKWGLSLADLVAGAPTSSASSTSPAVAPKAS